jgi:hypothetical protein
MESVMTYACPAWELVADIYLLKLQHLQNKVLRTIENPSSSLRGCYIRIMTARVQMKKKKPLVMTLKGLDSKMNCLVVNPQS